IKASEGVSERVGTESAGRGAAAGGGSGHGGRAGCVPRCKMGGTSEQGGVVLWACDWAASGVAKASAKVNPAPATRSQRPEG
ncbi:MAG: hypothetical protein ABSC15_26570, partial [Terriglobales bacterium]